jgi:hypothetical protein
MAAQRMTFYVSELYGKAVGLSHKLGKNHFQPRIDAQITELKSPLFKG